MGGFAIGILGILGLFVAILLGVNVMVALGAVGVIGLMAVVGLDAATAMLSTVFFETVHGFHFCVIPLFLLMGLFAMRAGLDEDLFEASIKWLGRLRGGLSISTTMGAAAFGAASGSSVGTATVFTKLALPQMLDRGYDKRLASASIAIAGTLAVMIPPSAVMVIYGILTDSSIGALLIAGVIPGAVFAVVLCLATYIWVWRRPELAPRFETRYSLKEKLFSLRLAGPLIVVIFCIIAGLYLGVFTPTEAGAVGAAVTLLLAMIRQRGLKGVRLLETLVETVKTTAMIFGIIICALIFSRFLALSGVANTLGAYLTGLDVNPWVIVLIITVIYLIFGMMMDAPALLAITL
ncbi:MAG: TRAP transporter large permease, partial [Burkholderiales bacterium]